MSHVWRKKFMLKRYMQKHLQKIINIIWVPSQGYKDSRHLLQNPKVPRNVMGFSNRAQRFT